MPHRRIRTTASPAGRIAAVVILVAIALAGAATAPAYWTTNGGGNGSGATGTAQAVTLTAGTPTVQLYPGGPGDVALTIDNPNLTRVKIGSLSLSAGQGTAGYSVDSGHAACATSALTFTTQTNGGAGWSVPPKVGSIDGSLSVDLANALTLSASAANACQGASFTIYLSAGA
jgi:hypothetical protein